MSTIAAADNQQTLSTTEALRQLRLKCRRGVSRDVITRESRSSAAYAAVRSVGVIAQSPNSEVNFDI